MAKFRYIGDQAEVTCWGVTFPRGKGVEVDEDAAAKLAGNDHFEPVKPRGQADGEDVN